MSLWQQNYDPAGNIWLSSLIASLPILFFFFALIKLKLKGYLAATYTVAIALLVALFFYKMPVDRALASVVYGFFYGLWPIAWIIIAAVFVYKISVKTGQFDIIRSLILSITPDQRLQMLIVGFSFGAFLEGAAGFGAPVAITGVMLMAIGFSALRAAVVVLVHTALDFEVFTTHHILPRQEKLVVTGADSASRRVYELNAEPAAEEYARLIGVPLAVALTERWFSWV